jgi:hypothetical protein
LQRRSALLACTACLYCLLVLLACTACLHCLLALLACTACLHCLLALLACTACLHCFAKRGRAFEGRGGTQWDAREGGHAKWGHAMSWARDGRARKRGHAATHTQPPFHSLLKPLPPRQTLSFDQSLETTAGHGLRRQIPEEAENQVAVLSTCAHVCVLASCPTILCLATKPSLISIPRLRLAVCVGLTMAAIAFIAVGAVIGYGTGDVVAVSSAEGAAHSPASRRLLATTPSSSVLIAAPTNVPAIHPTTSTAPTAAAPTVSLDPGELLKKTLKWRDFLSAE